MRKNLPDIHSLDLSIYLVFPEDSWREIWGISESAEENHSDSSLAEFGQLWKLVGNSSFFVQPKVFGRNIEL